MKTSFSALAQGLRGVQNGLRDLDRAAGQVAGAIADSPREPIGLADPLVAAIIAQRQIEASANVIRRVDATLDSMLDALAGR